MNREEKLAEIKRLKEESKKFFNYEQALKLILNSIYGAFGNEYFYFFDVDIAESITLQGQDAILYTEEMINKYFIDFWHRDTELHKKLASYIIEFNKFCEDNPNITEYKNLSIDDREEIYKRVDENYNSAEPIKINKKVLDNVCVYIDTDSNYVSFENVLKTFEWPFSSKDFILVIYQLRIKGYIERILEIYANKLNADNFLNFELESIAKSAIWMAKKKYIQELVWTDPDIHFDNLVNIKSKGFEIVQSSTSIFARNKLQELLTYVFSVDEVKTSEVVKILKKIKREFKLANIENLTINFKVNNYQKYIKNDYKSFEIESRCPMHVRASGYHNYLLNNSPQKGKYELISNGERVRMYFTNDEACNVFAFSAGNYPYEFAPSINYDAQFERTILEPFNRILRAMDLQTFDRNLIYSASLF
jgi:DNA polymerase elongation subunit (family B)